MKPASKKAKDAAPVSYKMTAKSKSPTNPLKDRINDGKMASAQNLRVQSDVGKLK